ncbi:alanine aminotransferase 1-like [Dysidea avara]|uniref:alanine aminotransferase 1-like n=1 Tax=Dysidea avara TaxID=196820 RepID=UPI003324D9BD
MAGLVCASRHRMSRAFVLCSRVCSAHQQIRGLRHYNSEDGGSSGKSLTLSTMNQNVRNMRYEVRGGVAQRADEIEEILKKPFSKVIKANIGNPHAMGQVPITFFRQVLALCADPDLIEHAPYPSDVKERARHILENCLSGHGIGAYTGSVGVVEFRKDVARFIEERDGYPADYENIYLTNGASDGIRSLLTLCAPDDYRVAFMSPVPQYPLYTACFSELGVKMIPYYLDEEKDWELNMTDLQMAVESARCKPRLLVVINPGNPTGQQLSKTNMVDIVDFCHQHKLLLLVDEVYQENVYVGKQEFISFKKVLREMGPGYNDVELVSFHSTSKGYVGECGIRGGYMEMVGVDQLVMDELEKYMSARLCPNTTGQVLVDLMVNPPRPGDESYDLFHKERSNILASLKKRAEMISIKFNKIPGMYCNIIQGSMYAFPRIHLPERAITKAEAKDLHPDEYYCLKLLEETGISFVPGSGFGQVEGTYHLRTTILADEATTDDMMDRVERFHMKFLAEHS